MGVYCDPPPPSDVLDRMVAAQERTAVALERIADGLAAVTYDLAPNCEQGIGVVPLGEGVTQADLAMVRVTAIGRERTADRATDHVEAGQP